MPLGTLVFTTLDELGVRLTKVGLCIWVVTVNVSQDVTQSHLTNTLVVCGGFFRRLERQTVVFISHTAKVFNSLGSGRPPIPKFVVSAPK